MHRLPLGAILLLIFLFMPLKPAAAEGTPLLPARPASGSAPLLPYLEYFLDESAAMDIEEIASRELASSFVPFSAERLPMATGVLWLRFAIAPAAADEKAEALALDMGSCVPGAPMLYTPVKNELAGSLEWREVRPGARNMLLLPQAGQVPITCYIRLEGLPGLWFSPVARSLLDVATTWESLASSAAILTLAVVLCLCVVRWMSELGQWRVWTMLFAALVLLQALAGLPPQVGNPGLWGLCAVLSPGIALMLMPHVGRHLLRAREYSRAIDIQLFFLALPGMACALLPLLPGWRWTGRWLELWPLGTLIFVPTALGAWLMGLAGSRRFLLACILPPFFIAAGVCGMYFGISPSLLASAPIWGVALATILLAATRAPVYALDEAARENSADGGMFQPGEIISLDSPINSENAGLGSPDLSMSVKNGDLAARLSNLNDPNLRLVPMEDDANAAGRLNSQQAGGCADAALRNSLDDLMREGAALERCSLPPAARNCAEKMLLAARKLAGIVSGAPVSNGERTPGERVFFNLQQILRTAHDGVAPAAGNAGIALGWYMPPHLPQLYHGVCGPLEEILGLLLESAVRATKSGAVQLSARRVPGSSDPGHILFTVSDSGNGYPPLERSAVALERAWELAGAHNGFISMEYGENGAVVAFSLHFTPVEEDTARTVRSAVAVLCENDGERQEILQKLASIDARILESASPGALLERQRKSPAAVLIVRGSMASGAAAGMLAEFKALAATAGYGICKIMAVHSDNSKDRELAASGYTHAIPEPLDAEELRATVIKLLAEVQKSFTPQDLPQRDGKGSGADDAGSEPMREMIQQPDNVGGEEKAIHVHPDTALGGQSGESADSHAHAEKRLHGALPEEMAAGFHGNPPAAGSTAEQLTAEQLTAEQLDDAPGSEAAAQDILPDSATVNPAGGENVEAQAGAADILTQAAVNVNSREIEETPPQTATAGVSVSGGDAILQDGTGDSCAAASTVDTARAQAGMSESGCGAMPPNANDFPRPEDAADKMIHADDSGRQAEESGQVSEENRPDSDVTPPELNRSGSRADGDADERTGGRSDGLPDGRSDVRPDGEEDAGEDAAGSKRIAAAPAQEGTVLREASESVFLSDTDVEWVGEPVPIVREKLPETGAGKQPVSPRPLRVPLPEEDFVEWVGEPVPIGTDPAQMKKPSPAARGAQGETPWQETRRLPEMSAPAKNSEHGNALGDFVSRTISHVSATIEKITRPNHAPDAAARRRMDIAQSSALDKPAQGRPAAVKGGGAVQERGKRADAPDTDKSPVMPDAARLPEMRAANGAPGRPGLQARRGVDPALFELISILDYSIGEARKAFAMNNAYAVAEYAQRISEEAGRFGLRNLSKLAQCVVRAGRAGDMGALKDILPELVVAVERNRITLTHGK